MVPSFHNADKTTHRRVMVVGALLYAGGLLLMRYAASPGALDLGAGVLIGFGAGLCVGVGLLFIGFAIFFHHMFLMAIRWPGLLLYAIVPLMVVSIGGSLLKRARRVERPIGEVGPSAGGGEPDVSGRRCCARGCPWIRGAVG